MFRLNKVDALSSVIPSGPDEITFVKQGDNYYITVGGKIVGTPQYVMINDAGMASIKFNVTINQASVPNGKWALETWDPLNPVYQQFPIVDGVCIGTFPAAATFNVRLAGIASDTEQLVSDPPQVVVKTGPTNGSSEYTLRFIAYSSLTNENAWDQLQETFAIFKDSTITYNMNSGSVNVTTLASRNMSGLAEGSETEGLLDVDGNIISVSVMDYNNSSDVRYYQVRRYDPISKTAQYCSGGKVGGLQYDAAIPNQLARAVSGDLISGNSSRGRVWRVKRTGTNTYALNGVNGIRVNVNDGVKVLAISTSGLVYMFTTDSALNVLYKFNPVNNQLLNIIGNTGISLANVSIQRAISHPNGKIYAFTASLADGIFILDTSNDSMTIQANPLPVTGNTRSIALDANAHFIILNNGFYDINPEDWTYEFYEPEENANRVNTGSAQLVTFGINGHTLWIPTDTSNTYLKDWDPYTKTGSTSIFSYAGISGANYYSSIIAPNGHIVSTSLNRYMHITPDQGDISIPVGLLLNPYFNQ